MSCLTYSKHCCNLTAVMQGISATPALRGSGVCSICAEGKTRGEARQYWPSIRSKALVLSTYVHMQQGCNVFQNRE
jgi:hypothetical protein